MYPFLQEAFPDLIKSSQATWEQPLPQACLFWRFLVTCLLLPLPLCVSELSTRPGTENVSGKCLMNECQIPQLPSE